MDIEIRQTTPDEYRHAAETLSVSYLIKPPDDERWAKSLPSWENMRSFSAWDGDRCVGHAGQHEVETTVPGGRQLPTAAITRVGVLPTHTRLGAGTGLMDALIGDAVDQRWPLASLRASESVIYRRYGFGIAGDFAQIEIDAARARPIRGASVGRFELLTPDQIESVTADIDEQALGRRSGLITRHGPWRRRHFGPAIDRTTGAFVAAHVDVNGHPDGYVFYDANWGEIFGEGGTGKVYDVVAISDDVELALWQYLLDVDLVRRWTSNGRPIDDLIREAVADRRAYAIKAINDEQWLRLIDVDAALAARSYSPTSRSVVIRVDDELVAANRGHWQIDGNGARTVDEPADLVATIDALSALYLGGNSWHTEAAVGRVEVVGERSPSEQSDVLTAADQLFSVKPLPFCGTFF